MITAIPLVKPITTGRGTNLITDPSRTAPRTTRITPAISVATIRPSTPNVWTIP